MNIAKKIYQELLSLHPVPPEIGGIIGGKDNTITEFIIDEGIPYLNDDCYMPNVEKLNNLINIWRKNKIQFYGIVHTHRDDAESLSDGDLRYIYQILSCNSSLCKIYFPIVIPHKKVIFYKSSLKELKLQITIEDINVI